MDSVVDFEMDNKTPGKDITTEDLETKFPLAAKKHDNHKTVVKIDDIEIGGNELIIFAGPNTVENREMILYFNLINEISFAYCGGWWK